MSLRGCNWGVSLFPTELNPRVNKISGLSRAIERLVKSPLTFKLLFSIKTESYSSDETDGIGEGGGCELNFSLSCRILCWDSLYWLFKFLLVRFSSDNFRSASSNFLLSCSILSLCSFCFVLQTFKLSTSFRCLSDVAFDSARSFSNFCDFSACFRRVLRVFSSSTIFRSRCSTCFAREFSSRVWLYLSFTVGFVCIPLVLTKIIFRIQNITGKIWRNFEYVIRKG